MFYIMISSSSIHIDAEHPTFIPMYTPTTLQALREHKTRPHLYTIGHKVNSLLLPYVRHGYYLKHVCYA